MRFWQAPGPKIDEQTKKRIFWGLLLGGGLRNLAAGAIAVFLPVYLFKVGGLSLAIWWFVVGQLFGAIWMRPLARLVAGLGFKKSVLLGQLLWVIGIFLVTLVERINYVWVAATLLSVVADVAFWIPYHLAFLQTSDKEFGKETGVISIVSGWSAAIGPIVGGALALGIGFESVFKMSGVVMALAAIPILVLEPDYLRWNFHLEEYWRKISGGWFRRDLAAYIGLGIDQAIYGYFWTIYLLLALKGSAVGLGAYKTVILVMTSLLQWVVAKRIDHGGVRKWVMAGTMLLMVMWVVRGNLTGAGQLLGLDIIDGLLRVIVFLPFGVYMYRRAITADKNLYIVEFEAAARVGGVIAGLVALAVVGLGGGWQQLVWAGGVGMGLTMLQPKIGPKQIEKIQEHDGEAVVI